ncbi:MAG: LPS export ABC transporter periplasmic protein LptC [Candidatus Poribacteria bacterium]
MANATRRRGVRYAALTLLAAAVWTACGADDDDIEPTATVAAEIDTFTMDHYNGSELRWVMTGDRAEVQSDGDTIFVDSPRVQLYDAGMPSVAITGEEGIIDKDTHNLTITRSVRAVAPDGVVLTEELVWDDEDGTLSSDTDVQLHRRDSVIYGSRMTGRPDLQQVHMIDVTFRLNPEDETIEPYPLGMLDTGVGAR